MLKFAVIGTGFWANYQIPAWLELEGIEIVALFNRTRSKAEALAAKHNIPRIYDSALTLMENETLDFVDIITDVDTHAPFTKIAANRGIGVICQKPMAPRLDIAKEMVQVCRDAGVPFFVHENWRWQAPMRSLKRILDEGRIGKIFKSRVTFCSAFPVFDNQPFLAELDEFILTDIGSHILDVVRFLFGEVKTLQCHTASVNPKIRGEDVANVFMRMQNGSTCYAEMSYASVLERESFPQTFVLVEGSEGSAHLTWDHAIHLTTRSGTEIITAQPPDYPWADPDYSLIHSSIVACNENILQALQGNGKGETTGADNLETVRLVHASYASAKTNSPVEMNTFTG